MSPDPAEGAFAYHRALAPMMWVLFGLSCIELLVVHLLLALVWSWGAAAVVSLLTIAGMAWIVALIRSMKRMPVLIGPDGIVMRTGFFRRIDLPWDAIAGPVEVPAAEALKGRDVANLALIAHPNVALALSRPVRFGRRAVMLAAHRLDAPERFLAALAGRAAAG